MSSNLQLTHPIAMHPSHTTTEDHGIKYLCQCPYGGMVEEAGLSHTHDATVHLYVLSHPPQLMCISNTITDRESPQCALLYPPPSTWFSLTSVLCRDTMLPCVTVKRPDKWGGGGAAGGLGGRCIAGHWGSVCRLGGRELRWRDRVWWVSDER